MCEIWLIVFSDLCYYSARIVCNDRDSVSAKQNKTSVRIHEDFIVFDLDIG